MRLIVKIKQLKKENQTLTTKKQTTSQQLQTRQNTK